MYKRDLHERRDCVREDSDERGGCRREGLYEREEKTEGEKELYGEVLYGIKLQMGSTR